MAVGAMVMVDGDSLTVVCPAHGALPGAEYAPGRAACGCVFVADSHGILRAQALTLQQEVPSMHVIGHKGQTT